MSERSSVKTSRSRWLVALLGMGLFWFLVRRVGAHALWTQLHALRYAILAIIGLGGFSHCIKTFAWRLTFTCDTSRLSWPRSFATRLVSEAIGQLGIAGKVIGEGARVSLLGSAVPRVDAVSSAVLDNGLYTFTSLFVAMAGVLAASLLAPIPAGMRVYAFLFAGGLALVLFLLALSFAQGWRILGPAFKAMGRLPWCRGWVLQKQATVNSTEDKLLSFHRTAPAAFWSSLLLNVFAHLLAITEIYLILRSLTPRATLLGALTLEGLTKLISGIGAFNPGNVGTYEAGNVLITKLFGIQAAAGLTLALCRRARALFWAAIGVVCLIFIQRNVPQRSQSVSGRKDETAKEKSSVKSENIINCKTMILLSATETKGNGFSPLKARLATLPLLMRNILTAQASEADRIIVCVPRGDAKEIQEYVARTGRLSSSIEWREVQDLDLVSLIAEAGSSSRTLALVEAGRSYQPKLISSAWELDDENCLMFETDGELAGIYVLPNSAANAIVCSHPTIRTLKDLHSWMLSRRMVEVREIDSQRWHRIDSPEDLAEAERKLDSWLTKSTDGIFARMNRRVSIPISRQLIKLPVTPNMVTFFVLAVSLACGAFYARGGYWNFLIAALLSLAASILDGCDGEVARLKLQSTRLGCWLDSICDYTYYVVAFGGMAVGLTRESGSRTYLVIGAALLFGAITMFLVVSLTRQRISGLHPEKFLAVWQKKAESRSSNPLMYLARQCEFILRRCFLPYLLLFFAIVNVTKFAFVAASIGANLAWMIASYSYFDVSRISPKGTAAMAPGATA